MGRYQYSKSEQQRNNVLVYQTNELKKLRASADASRDERECEIAILEEKLRQRGINPHSVQKNTIIQVPKK